MLLAKPELIEEAISYGVSPDSYDLIAPSGNLILTIEFFNFYKDNIIVLVNNLSLLFFKNSIHYI